MAAVPARASAHRHTGSEAGRTKAQRPVDLAHLSRYTLGDRSLEREVLHLFRTQARIYLDRLENAEDATTWLQAAHTIKGSAQGIGAWDVMRAAEAAEQLASAPAAPGRDAKLSALGKCIEEASAFIDELLLVEG